jgi:hypothetical protein
MNNIFMDKIYVSVASFMDLELGFTIYDMLSKAKYPNRLFVSIYDQDDQHVDLTKIFEKFNFTSYVHKKVHYADSRGVGHARYETQKNLSFGHKYYFQIDSHTRFIQDWDVELIYDYEFFNPHWEKYIYSTYPQAFEFGDDDEKETLVQQNFSNNLKIVSSNIGVFFESKYDDYVESPEGQETGYFCGGFAFGYASLFPKNNVYAYFTGEEQMLSVRFFDNDIKIVAPFRNYIFHDYDGGLRKRNWEKNSDWAKLQEKSHEVLQNFFKGKILKPYGVSRKTVDSFMEKFVVSESKSS